MKSPNSSFLVSHLKMVSAISQSPSLWDEWGIANILVSPVWPEGADDGKDSGTMWVARAWGIREEETHLLHYSGLQPLQYVSQGYLHFPEVALGEKGHKAFSLFSQHGHHVHKEQSGHHLLWNHSESLNDTGEKIPGWQWRGPFDKKSLWLLISCNLICPPAN